MIKITHGEDSKLSGWYFEIDRGLLGCILLLTAVGLLTVVSVGAAQAARMGQPWFFFIKKAFLPYMFGLFALFVCSMFNKKQVIRISVAGLLVGIAALLITIIHPVRIKGSTRWAHIGSFGFMPAEILKPFFIILTAWFLSKMHNVFGSDIFLNKDAWQFKKISWWPYLLLFVLCVGIIFSHPDVGTAILFTGVLFVMLFVAGFPVKWLPGMFGVFAGLATLALMVMPHVRNRALQIFDIQFKSQVWYSLNSIRHGGLFGSGDKSYVKDVLPESTNDFVYSAFAEDWGTIGACGLLFLLFFVFNKLIKHAIYAKDEFVVYAVSGAAALFAGQICFNLMTALHLVINKGMTLPFISYGGVSFIVFCVLFGLILAIIREDTWNNAN